MRLQSGKHCNFLNAAMRIKPLLHITNSCVDGFSMSDMVIAINQIIIMKSDIHQEFHQLLFPGKCLQMVDIIIA